MAWLSFYAVFRKYLDISQVDGLLGTINMGWWWPFEDAVIITERPVSLTRDNDNRLHHESAQAIEYPDGFGVAAWHGTRIPREWVLDKKSVDINDCFSWENAEQRRCLCEMIGWEKVLEKTGATLIHADPDDPDTVGRLMEANPSPATGDEVARFLLVVNPSDGRKFAIPVPREMATARQAAAWTYQLEEKDYAPLVRT